MNDKRDYTALTITVCAVITAMPRWIGALLASEGFAVPDDWRSWWLIASAIFNAAMAITEGAAFAYVFHAWRNQRDKSADRLLWFAGLSGVTFIIVLAPFIAAQVRERPLDQMLSADWALWVWSVGVAASTIVIVASVGYAQKRKEPATIAKKPAIQREPNETELATEPLPIETASFACQHCPAEFATVQALNAHKRFCAGKVAIETLTPNGNH